MQDRMAPPGRLPGSLLAPGAWILPALALTLAGWGCSDSSTPVIAPLYGPDEPVALYLEEPCGERLTVDLLTRRQEQAGFVVVENDEQTLRLTLDVRGTGWLLAKSRVTVTGPREDRPLPRAGQLRGERFQSFMRHDPPVTLWSCDVDLAAHGYTAGSDLLVSVHVVVQMVDEDGNPIRTEQAWAIDRGAPRGPGAIRFHYVVQSCDGGSDPCGITCLFPNGGEELCAGWEEELRWSSTFCGDQVRIELLHDGQSCGLIAEAAPNTGSYFWTVAPCNWESEGYTIRVTDLGSGAAGGSDGGFSISDCGGE